MKSFSDTEIFEDAEIIFRNFSGVEGEYNAEGDRNFCLLLPEHRAAQMRKDGWNVKTLKVREEGDVPQSYIQVAVAFGRRPPKLVLVTRQGRTTLSEEEVALFDWIDIAAVDLIIRPYEWAKGGRSGIKAYLKSMFITVAEDALDIKYADVPEITRGAQAQLELPPGPDPVPAVIEGEWM